MKCNHEFEVVQTVRIGAFKLCLNTHTSGFFGKTLRFKQLVLGTGVLSAEKPWPHLRRNFPHSSESGEHCLVSEKRKNSYVPGIQISEQKSAEKDKKSVETNFFLISSNSSH